MAMPISSPAHANMKELFEFCVALPEGTTIKCAIPLPKCSAFDQYSRESKAHLGVRVGRNSR